MAPAMGDPIGRNRIVADAASDVAHIADALGGRAQWAGRAGAPHALACAAMLRDRVERAAAMVSPAPPEAEGLDWFEGMTRSNVETYELADADTLLAEAELGRRAADFRADPEQMMASLLPGLAGLDGRVVNAISLRRLVTETIRDGLRESADGWIDDVLALRRPWGCDLSDITASSCCGMAPRTVLSSRALAVAGGQIKDATLLIEKGAAHFGAFEVLPEALAWFPPHRMKQWPPAAACLPTCQYGIRSERLRVDRAQQPPILPDDGNARVLGVPTASSKPGGQDRPPSFRLAQAL